MLMLNLGVSKLSINMRVHRLLALGRDPTRGSNSGLTTSFVWGRAGLEGDPMHACVSLLVPS